jgi:hypothetical protein
MTLTIIKTNMIKDYQTKEKRLYSSKALYKRDVIKGIIFFVLFAVFLVLAGNGDFYYLTNK